MTQKPDYHLIDPDFAQRILPDRVSLHTPEPS